MNKYILFSFNEYYPSGGLADVRGSSDSLAQVVTLAIERGDDYQYVLDRDTWQTVWERES